MSKAEVANTNIKKDIEFYKNKCEEREKQIETIKAEIAKLTEDLVISEIIKNKKGKYELTSKSIVKLDPEEEMNM